MNCGKQPFFLDEKGALALRLKPLLAGWLFDKSGEYSFNFLSKVRVTYINKARKPTFGKNPAKINRISFTDTRGRPIEITSDTILSPYAEQIRNRQISSLTVYLS
jgi:hypothetical protein